MRYVISLFLISVFFLFNACTSKQEKEDKYLKNGIELIRAGDNKKAIENFTKTIELQSENYEAYYYRANAKFNLRNANEAIADYNKAIELKPDYADAYYNRAFCKQFLNDKDGACKDWQKADALGKPNVKDLLNVCH